MCITNRKLFLPRVQDEGDDIFESVGTSATTMGIMSGSNFPKSSMLHTDCVRNEICTKLPESWHQIQVFDKGNKQMFGGEWTQYFFIYLTKVTFVATLHLEETTLKKRLQKAKS